MIIVVLKNAGKVQIKEKDITKTSNRAIYWYESGAGKKLGNED